MGIVKRSVENGTTTEKAGKVSNTTKVFHFAGRTGFLVVVNVNIRDLRVFLSRNGTL